MVMFIDNVYCRLHLCHLMKKKEMSFDYAETSEMNSKDASIQCGLPYNDPESENDNDCANVESKADDGSDTDHGSDEE